MSTYYAPPAGTPETTTGPQTPAPALIAFAGPADQSRLTVLVRVFMILPQLIVLGVLGVAAYVVTIIGWVGALFTGRLPDFAADFLTGYLRWMTRVDAYAVLLTDVYPPFSLADADYPVRVAVAPGRLNRLAVLFRFFLLIPCWIVAGIVAYGAFTIVAFVSWLIVLIAGRMPDPLHAALAATLRYQVRTFAFAVMLTSAYPAGLFGDPQYGAPSEYGDASWRLVLSGAARKLVGGFIVLGVLLAVGVSVLDTVVLSNSGPSAATANAQVLADAAPAVSAISNYQTPVKACKGVLACVEGVDRQVAAKLNTFAKQLPGISMPSAQARAADAAMAASVSRTAAIYSRLGAATSLTQYYSLAGAANIDGSVNQLNAAYTKLHDALNS
jgi:Domain of unknown function (DUF4389)